MTEAKACQTSVSKAAKATLLESESFSLKIERLLSLFLTAGPVHYLRVRNIHIKHECNMYIRNVAS